MKNILILIAAVGLALCGCQSQTQPNPTVNTIEEKNAIEATLKNYEAVLNASDVDGVLSALRRRRRLHADGSAHGSGQRAGPRGL